MLSNELIKKFQVFSKYPHRSFNELEYLLKTNKKALYSDIAKINDSLQKYHYRPIQIEKGYLLVPNISIADLFESLFPDFDDYLFQEERRDMIILYILLNQQFISNYHLQELLRISKNSVLSDLKAVKKDLLSFKVNLNYSRQRGYYFEGRGVDLRRLLEKTIVNLLAFSSGKWTIQYVALHCHVQLAVKDLLALFISLGKKDKLSFISEKMNEVCYLLAVLNELTLKSDLSDDSSYHLEEIYKTRVGQFIKDLLSYFPNLAREKTFVASRIAGCVQGDYFDAPDERVTSIMSDIIDLVRANAGLEFQDSLVFRQNLYMHLLPAYYRLLFDMVLVNPLKSQIMMEYPSLFYLVKKSLAPLQAAVGKPVSDDEVAYFTIHFGGYLSTRPPVSTRKLTALSVCPNGISSSLIMQSQLQSLFPQIHFREVHQLDKIQNSEPTSYDLIFSTIYFENKKPIYVVQPLMNPIEKMILKKKVCQDFQLAIDDVSIEALLAIISKHATIHDSSSLINDLSDYVIGAKQIEEIGGLGLLDLLRIDFIQQAEAVKDWQEAIRLAAKPLLDKQYIEASYIDGMIESVNQLGAYIVLAPKVAVPHASPDYGVNKLGISLLQLKEAVDFDLEKEGDADRQVQLVFVLAAIDTRAHLKALQQLAMVLEDEKAIEAMIKAEKKEDILAIMNRTIEEGEKDD